MARRVPVDRALRLAVWAGAVLLLVGAVVASRRLVYDPLGLLTSAASQALVYLAAATVLVFALLLRRRARVWPHVVVAGTSCLLSGQLVIALAETPFGLGGLDADQSFRTAAMTRFSLTAAPVDFGYAGHGTFIPPLWYWVAGRSAAALGQPGWEAMKWAQVVSAFLVPAVGYWFWRRVAPPGAAALAVAVGVLAVPDPVKGDEWLSLVVMLPWWLDAFADVRAPGVARLPAWVHGLVAGAMLSLYTAFFLPAALATLLVAGVAVHRRRWREPLRRWTVLVAVGLVAWSWVWVPALHERLTGPPFRLSQLEWFGDTSPTWAPVTLDLVGVLSLAGLLGLAWGAQDRRPLRMHAVFAAAVLGVLVLGLLAAAAGHPVLVQKTYPMLSYVLVTAAAVTGYGLLSERSRAGTGRRAATTAVTLATAVLVTLGLQYVLDTVRPDRALGVAYRTPTPSGAVSRYSREPAPTRASADQVVAAVGAGPDAVVLSDRYDVFAFHGYWNFNQFTSHYAHPHARHQDRLRLVQQVADSRDPEEVWRLLRDNGIQRVDALVLSRDDQGVLTYRYRRNNYPDGTVPVTLTFHPEAFADASRFEVIALPGCSVVRPREPGPSGPG